ncbi:hypothetical protein BTO30_14045 [Domibacillus antri]|uniref:Uncharacterized protein n=1 Tax=Domibacillus antri TaxID=1714264 RepID=A0A1Q8Q2P0_9BACI|nr:hypothetical protein [Domibacillus antri]OLN21600.1 hypothetical protein BTO30_14045 [Domibacillus antri]
MNKVTGFMGAALLAGGILAGCSADSENPAPEENTTDEAVTPAETDQAAEDTSKATENASEDIQKKASDTVDTVEEEAADLGAAVEEGSSNVQESVDNVIEADGQEATGTFNGLVDPHTVEIEVDGVPASYQVDPEGDIMPRFEQLTAGDSVTFVFVENGEQLVIKELK